MGAYVHVLAIKRLTYTKVNRPLGKDLVHHVNGKNEHLNETSSRNSTSETNLIITEPIYTYMSFFLFSKTLPRQLHPLYLTPWVTKGHRATIVYRMVLCNTHASATAKQDDWNEKESHLESGGIAQQLNPVVESARFIYTVCLFSLICSSEIKTRTSIQTL